MTATIDPAINCELLPLTTFKFEGLNVRIQDRDGSPWWVLADACRVLEIGNPSDAARRLDDDEKMTLDTVEGDKINGLGTVGAMPTIISESGLYSLILRSRKPAAKRFKKWVTGTVLPSIRKHGGYVAGQEQVAAGQKTREEFLAEALLMAQSILEDGKARAAALEGENAALGAKVERLSPKAAALDLMSEKIGEAGLQETSKELTGRAMALIEWMKANKWIFRRNEGGNWIGYQDKIAAGYLVMRERPERHRTDRTRPQTMITPKGRAKLAELLTQGDLLQPGAKRRAA